MSGPPAAAPPDPRWLATAVDAVVRAGAVQRASFGHVRDVGKKGAIDLVTEVDVEVERAFRATMADRFPDHTVLGEEMATEAERLGARPAHCWVFDPLDGTTNFAHGLPIFCASLGFEVEGVAMVAAVYDPTRDELFTAERGGGARLNGRPLAVSHANRLIDAMLCTGFPYDVHQRTEEIVGLFAEFVRRARAVRRLGSAALDLCYVAAGRLDGFWEAGLKPWDTCAGALIAHEAGATVTTWDGRPFDSRAGTLVTSNGRLHAAMLEVIAAFEARGTADPNGPRTPR